LQAKIIGRGWPLGKNMGVAPLSVGGERSEMMFLEKLHLNGNFKDK